MSSKATVSGTKVDEDTEDNFKRQGSFRKLLPANTNGDSQLSMSAKMIERPNLLQNNKEYRVFLQEHSILFEYKMVCIQDLKGIYVIPSAQNSFLWFGVQFVRQGIYQGGVFRFTITLPPNFPDGGCPKVVFQTNVFHPLINPDSGELYLAWNFPEWKRTNRVWSLIQFITKILTKVDSKMTPINQVAAALLETDVEKFQKLAKESVKNSLSQVYDPPPTDDPHYITFSPYDNDLHDPIKEEIYQPKEERENKTVGFSWVQPGSLQPFSKSETR
ncbi:protein crossbronx homolog isoform X2 [Cephus cinctus]|uniref:Protein crossbronx homolog isoform X2 n=1 Tax=Cephus cinctus TaxID=211228 RepID=A0AAJ7BSE4_CEPCN|nr:protein crossbronx homolog isoform X2 [Cephus cinctus]